MRKAQSNGMGDTGKARVSSSCSDDGVIISNRQRNPGQYLGLMSDIGLHYNQKSATMTTRDSPSRQVILRTQKIECS